MKLQIDFSFDSPLKFKSSDQFFLLGSCFSESIAGFLREHLFHFVSNPFGILFDPVSIARALEIVIDNENLKKDILIVDNGFWHSPYHHGTFSGTDPNQVLQRINSEIEFARLALKKTELLIVTFGTAFVWKQVTSGKIFANCHKIPGNQFKKEFLSAEEILSVWKKIILKLREFNPGLKIVFSVSPVRYLRDGLIENNKSKAALLSSVHKLCEEEKTIYFPSYELVIDVLRDYRFYKEDLVHPNKQSVNYVWGIFKNSFFDKQSLTQLSEIASYNEFKSHRPIRNIDQHKEKVIGKKADLKLKYPQLNWSLDENN